MLFNYYEPFLSIALFVMYIIKRLEERNTSLYKKVLGKS